MAVVVPYNEDLYLRTYNEAISESFISVLDSP